MKTKKRDGGGMRSQVGAGTIAGLAPWRFLVVTVALFCAIEGCLTLALPSWVSMDDHPRWFTLLDMGMLAMVGGPILWMFGYGPLCSLVNDERRMRARLEAEWLLIASVIERAPEGIAVIDEVGDIRALNRAAIGMLGMPEVALVGRSLPELLLGEHGRVSSLKEGTREFRVLRDDGSEVTLEVGLGEMNRGDASWYSVILRDVTERRRGEEAMRRLALYDPLTGLPNRTLLLDRLRHAMVQAEREAAQVAVLFLDMDRFKQVNDTLGHRVGDLLLRAIAQRLQEAMRAGDTVARLGGDEFVVVLPGVAELRDVEIAARRAAESLSAPYVIEGRALSCLPSIGISLYARDGQDVAELLDKADAAMYRAKREPRTPYVFYVDDLPAAGRA